MDRSLVIIPTFNEIENIVLIVQAVLSQYEEFDLLVVDDNSPDGTSEAVVSLMENFQGRLFLERRLEKKGLGTAYIHGFRWALDKGYDYIFEMDADFSHDPKDLGRLLKACKQDNVGIAIGSRYIKGVNVVNWPLSRILLSYGASWYVRLITGMKIKDPTAGFVCYKRQVLASVNLDEIKFIGYAFQIEMKYKAHLKNFKLQEIPIIFTERVRGVSKLNKGIIYEAISGVIQLKLESILNKKTFDS